jgi:SsrA-binding protein
VSKAPDKNLYKNICVNKKASFEYELEERMEAGLVLAGSEVKSLRMGKASLLDAYARIVGGEAWLLGSHISQCPSASYNNHEPERRRKLLLHAKEIKKLTAKTREKGRSIIPLKMYFKDGVAKVEIALAKGKKKYDKRQSIKEKDNRREMARQRAGGAG